MLSGGDLIQILRGNHSKKKGGLSIKDAADKNTICVVEKISNKKDKFVANDIKSLEKNLYFEPEDYAIYPHIPLGVDRFIIFCSGHGGMGKSSITSLMMKQAKKHIKGLKVYYICGTSAGADENISKLNFCVPLKGEMLQNINVERDFKNSLIVFDDIDNYEYHKEAIKIMNKAYEVGRKFNINIIYISHNTTKATESKIYDEVNMYITNKATHNRMFEHYLELKEEVIEEITKYLKTDVFICYNKIYNTLYTDKRVFRLE